MTDQEKYGRLEGAALIAALELKVHAILLDKVAKRLPEGFDRTDIEKAAQMMRENSDRLDKAHEACR